MGSLTPVRFEDTFQDSTEIHFVTDGVLLRNLLYERFYTEYDFIMVDEVHERTIFIDIILYLLKTRLEASIGKTAPFKLILTSATMQLEKFRNYFEKFRVKTIEIESKAPFPIELIYSPNSSSTSSIHHAVSETLAIHTSEPDGDVLVFLPGSQECLRAMNLLAKQLEELNATQGEVPGCQIFSLFGTQAVQEQMRVFREVDDKLTTRKIIFATNIAETSVTIPNIGYVVDSGLVKLPYYDSLTNGVSLKTVSISKSQAVQRTGRAGRTRPGKSIRLYRLLCSLIPAAKFLTREWVIQCFLKSREANCDRWRFYSSNWESSLSAKWISWTPRTFLR